MGRRIHGQVSLLITIIGGQIGHHSSETKGKTAICLGNLWQRREREKTFRFIKEELVQHKQCMDWHRWRKRNRIVKTVVSREVLAFQEK